MSTLGTQMRVRHLLRVWAEYGAGTSAPALPVRLLRLLRDAQAGWVREAAGVPLATDMLVRRSLEDMRRAAESLARPDADRTTLWAQVREGGEALLEALERLERRGTQGLARTA
jgi:hypothetical protein